MNLNENDKYMCGSKQTTKHFWESWPKSELKYLYNIESNLTKILQDKRKKFQHLLKEMEKRLKDEYQSKTRDVGDLHDE